MSAVVVTGAGGELGRRVVALAAADGDVDTVLAIDTQAPSPLPTGATFRKADILVDDLKPLLEGADVVVHLAHGMPMEPADAKADVDGTRRLLDAAGDAGVGHVVAVSSATVYGAWPQNPVPLTEDAPVRPNPGFEFGLEKAEVERLCGDWVEGHPGSTAAVLRPVAAVGDQIESWLARSLRAALLLRAGDDPPTQLLHLDDLAAAVDVARRQRVSGVLNVAPDSWIEGDQLRALAGAPPRLPMPAAVAHRLTAWLWRLRLGPTPPGILPYTLHPWVVANDRIRAAGWEPRHGNDEAFVGSSEGTPWSRVTPKRRQELALGAAVAGIAGVAVGGVLLVRRLRRSRSR